MKIVSLILAMTIVPMLLLNTTEPIHRLQMLAQGQAGANGLWVSTNEAAGSASH
jgi:hypothetical protein